MGSLFSSPKKPKKPDPVEDFSEAPDVTGDGDGLKAAQRRKRQRQSVDAVNRSTLRIPLSGGSGSKSGGVSVPGS